MSDAQALLRANELYQNRIDKRNRLQAERRGVVQPIVDEIDKSVGARLLTPAQAAILKGIIGDYIRERRPSNGVRALQILGDHYNLWTQHQDITSSTHIDDKLQEILSKVYGHRKSRLNAQLQTPQLSSTT